MMSAPDTDPPGVESAKTEGAVQPWSTPLKQKLLTWLLWPLMALMVVDAVVGYYVTAHFAAAAYDRTLGEMAREVLLEVQGGSGDELVLPPSAQRIILEDPDDKIFYRVIRQSDKASVGEASLVLPGSLTLKAGRIAFFDTVLEDEDVRVAVLLGVGNGKTQPDMLILVAETVNKRNTLFREILAGVVMPQLVLALLVGILVSTGVVRGLAPLRRLEQTIATRSHLDLSPVVTEVPEGVRPLVDEINALMARLSEVLEFQNRFIADAAHQLRTPVAGLKAQIEIVLRERDPERLKQSMEHIYTGMERLSRLVAQLLSLARNEPNAVRNLQLGGMDLNRLVFETTMEWVPAALDKGIDLGFDGGEEPVMIQGDPARLKELINNLFDNAIRYTPDNGRVTAMVTRDPAPAFSISDDGPAIPVEEREHVFERFHRLLGTNTEGSGLGLAIVNEIAKLHGAEVRLMEDKDGIGNTFVVTFPLPSDAGGVRSAYA
ncbi:MAG: sensor histidine kinase N-terminal domain-containing protein [Rhodocyclaceae bacterium]|nr:sensor histidine kinase N-terminal domain-containing protein [Rhodocyclaceae bacterium]